ncbi:MAG: hypothetical protein ACLFPA_05440 [Dichotomicrobium sp.]
MRALIVVVSLGALWDGYTSFYGIAEFYDLVTGTSAPMRFVFAGIAAITIVGFMIATRLIWSAAEPNNAITILLKTAWVVCFVIDLYTSFIGTRDWVFGGMAGGSANVMGLLVMSFLVTSSSVLLSQLITGKGIRKRYLY